MKNFSYIGHDIFPFYLDLIILQNLKIPREGKDKLKIVLSFTRKFNGG